MLLRVYVSVNGKRYFMDVACAPDELFALNVARERAALVFEKPVREIVVLGFRYL